MTPDHARRMAAHGRRLLTAKIITPHQYACLDALLWRLRKPGRFDLAVDYKTIARLAGVCRDTAINAVRKLVDIGLIQKIKRRVKVRWGRTRALLASRQIANAYCFRALATESASPAADRGEVRPSFSVMPETAKESALEGALMRLARAMAGRHQTSTNMTIASETSSEQGI